jgi:hypothetical protein
MVPACALDHRPGCHHRAIQDQEHAEDTRHDEPRINVTGVIEESGLQQHLTELICAGRLDRLFFFPAQTMVVGLNHAFRITLTYSGRIGVHRIQQKLHSGGTSTLQVAGIIVRNHHSGIQLVPADRVPEPVAGR